MIRLKQVNVNTRFDQPFGKWNNESRNSCDVNPYPPRMALFPTTLPLCNWFQHQVISKLIDIANYLGMEMYQQLQHVVIQAVAIFPYIESVVGSYPQSKLWQSISRIGIGANPALPGDLIYLREWLVQAFRNGGWAMADRSIPHVAQRRIAHWKQAEGDPVLVGTLRGRNPQQHFKWIQTTRSYYVRYSKTQPRQLQIKQVAFYLPQKLEGASAITHVADVAAISVVRRDEITTPWSTNFQSDQPMVFYRLGKIRPMPQSIKYHHGDKTSIQSPRYTTRLGLQRARLLSEIALETEAEWRLFEMLTAANIPFTIEATTVKRIDPSNPTGRARFRITRQLWVRFDGLNGYRITHRTTSSYTSTPSETLKSVQRKLEMFQSDD